MNFLTVFKSVPFEVYRNPAQRQRYHISFLNAPRVLHLRLIEHGFQPNYFALVDQGEMFNLRRLVFRGAEVWQEHVRIFPDELRAHFEIAYDYELGDAIEHVRGTTIQEVLLNTKLELLDLCASQTPMVQPDK
jgi:hypothetical protein